ncbi:hypothetical protein [Methylobacterium sp. AMS5]|uniref:hypothetical protein n=1 Tax=Methylobacterium sp. AMS5 TaxID=925818 RepID=UPI00074FA388|nr:hypothetical protein [Methylobacterium sp. AMS5]AMB48309.1 hypothetical protein Y590_25410 [Methylobacterium sp. AMS5]
MTITGTDEHHTHITGEDFDPMVRALQKHFLAGFTEHGRHLFTTDVDTDALYETYLSKVPAGQRQYHTCNCCKTFIRNFGGLVYIADDGRQFPAIWGSQQAPETYLAAVDHMRVLVREARVTGVFLSKERMWGTPEAGGFTHFAIQPHREQVFMDRAKSAFEAMAEKRQDYGTLSHGLIDYKADVVAQALNLLKADVLASSEKFVDAAQFLHELHSTRAGKRGAAANNVVWKAVAMAPAGWAKPRSTMLGTLLDALKIGKDVEQLKREFGAKVAPLRYQRAQVAPTTGNIAVAEKKIERLGLAPSLKRRHARIEDLTLLWQPKAVRVAPAAGGVFGHLKAKGTQRMASLDVVARAPAPITWSKFARTVLPDALKIEVLTATMMKMIGLTAAVEPDSPPILLWDREEARNPIAWYVYPRGKATEFWNLPVGAWVEVPGISLLPPMYAGEDAYPQYSKTAIFLLRGAVDSKSSGLALFPSCLHGDLHEIRSTIEAFSNDGSLENQDDQSANGVRVGDNHPSPLIRVTTNVGSSIHRIDRWD